MSAVAGRVLLIPKGSYNSGITYNMLDVVTYEYDSYVAKTTTIGHDPTDTTYWQKMTDVGDDVNSLKETFTNNGAHNLLPMTLVGIKAANTSGTWSGNVYTWRDLTFTVQTDDDGNVKGIVVNGTATGRIWFNLFGYENNIKLPKGSYILSKDSELSNAQLVIEGYNGSTWNRTLAISASVDEIQIDIDYSGYDRLSAYVNVNDGISVNNVTLKPMIRLASDPDSTFEPYAMTNKELTNLAQAEARISAESRAWPGDTLIFKDLPKSNGRWYEFTACVSYSDARFSKGFIILREDGNIVVNGKQGDFTVAYNQDGDLVITLPTSAHWIYDMRRSGELT